MLEQELKLLSDNERTLIAVRSCELVTSILSGTVIGPLLFHAKYYDTPDRLLTSQLCSLRSRREGSVYRAALKEKGDIIDGLSSRMEFECDVDGWISHSDQLPDGKLKNRLLQHIVSHSALIELVEIKMNRTILNLQIDGALIEMVTDEGTIASGGKQTSHYEVELELKKGEVEVLREMGSRLMADFNLVPATKTKHQIGLELA